MAALLLALSLIGQVDADFNTDDLTARDISCRYTEGNVYKPNGYLLLSLRPDGTSWVIYGFSPDNTYAQTYYNAFKGHYTFSNEELTQGSLTLSMTADEGYAGKMDAADNWTIVAVHGRGR